MSVGRNNNFEKLFCLQFHLYASVKEIILIFGVGEGCVVVLGVRNSQ